MNLCLQYWRYSLNINEGIPSIIRRLIHLEETTGLLVALLDILISTYHRLLLLAFMSKVVESSMALGFAFTARSTRTVFISQGPFAVVRGNSNISLQCMPRKVSCITDSRLQLLSTNHIVQLCCLLRTLLDSSLYSNFQFFCNSLESENWK